MHARTLISVVLSLIYFSLYGQNADSLREYSPEDIGRIRVEYARDARYEEWLADFKQWQHEKGTPRTHADSAVWYALQAAFAYTYFDLRQMDSAEVVLLPVLDINVSHFPDEYLKVHNAWGVRLIYGGRFSEAQKHYAHFRELLDTKTLTTTPSQYCNIVHNLGVANSQLGDYDAALEVFHHIEDVIEKEHIDDNRLNINLHMNLAGAHAAMKQPALSLEHSRLSYAYSLKEHGPDHPVSAQTRNSIANGYILLNKLDSALAMYMGVLDIYKNIDRLDHPLRTISLLNVAETLDKLNRTEEGLPYIQECIDIRKRTYGLRHAEVARAYKAKGRILGHLRQYNEAIQSLDTALIALGYDALSENPYSGVDAMFNLFYTLDHKADIYYWRALEQASQENLQDAYEAYVHGIRVLNDLRNHFKGKLSKGTLNEKSYILYEPAIDVCLQLYEKTGDAGHLAQAMIWSSESKGNDFYDLIRGAQAMVSSHVPDSIRNHDESFQKSLAELESAWYDAKQKSPSDISDARHKLDETKKRYREWLTDIESDYPAYYELLHANITLNLQSVQKELAISDAQLIEYFVGDSNAFAFVLTPDALNYVRLSHPGQIQKSIELWRKSFDSFNTNEDALSAQVWHPLIKYLGTQTHLIIVPDGGLTSVPFEILQDEEGVLTLERFNISYDFSSRGVLRNSHVRDNHRWLGMAPSYASDATHLALASRGLDSAILRSGDMEWVRLPGAESEIQQISLITGGEKRVGKEATESYFRKMAHEFGIMHLSMHAWTDDAEPLLSTLIFSEEETDTAFDGKLYAHEIFQLDLPAQLAVLSACNTGIGTFRRGEGISSLARAFLFAGTEATVMSLWKVPDESTSFIMQSFYKHLRNGETKDDALRHAKQDYLNNVTEPEQKSPYYWAGFVLMGDTSPVYYRGISARIIILLAGVVILGGFLLWRLRAKRQLKGRIEGHDFS